MDGLETRKRARTIADGHSTFFSFGKNPRRYEKGGGGEKKRFET